ncbi:MAG TPA: hypothetical protein VMR62_23705 [Bryobacteraceae bacterium]|nr:hypothetical protein [Bryobacteraceae bacterium]
MDRGCVIPSHQAAGVTVKFEMAAATIAPVEEYLQTNYDPDLEYVDGQLVERNVG